MAQNSDKAVAFLQWALPRMGFRWQGFRKPRGQVLKRIRERMHELRLSGGYSEYRDYLESHPEEWDHLDRLCDITISTFFRDRKLWDYLRDRVLADLIREQMDDPVQIWSAGCCNGEEPYSLSMICEQLSSRMDEENIRPIAILATDRNAKVLERARRGRYPAGALKELTDEEIRSFFQNIKNREGEDDYKIDTQVHKYMEFDRRDIRDSLPNGVFDLVLCRNLVFTYFLYDRQVDFLERLRPHLCKNGFLVIGSNENIPETGWLKKVSDTHPVFLKRE